MSSLRKVVWICKLDGRSVGEGTVEKDMINLLAGQGGFVQFIHYDNSLTRKQKGGHAARGVIWTA
jgi:hypothetical protein